MSVRQVEHPPPNPLKIFKKLCNKGRRICSFNLSLIWILGIKWTISWLLVCLYCTKTKQTLLTIWTITSARSLCFCLCFFVCLLLCLFACLSVSRQDISKRLYQRSYKFAEWLAIDQTIKCWLNSVKYWMKMWKKICLETSPCSRNEREKYLIALISVKLWKSLIFTNKLN